VRSLRLSNPRAPGASVAAEDMVAYAAATNTTKVEKHSAFVLEKASATGKVSLFASDLRVMCTNCARATPKKLDAQKNFLCFFCGATQEVARAAVVLDADNDGMPDDWEKRHGLDPKDPADASADKDGDDFTNLEEFLAKTDPTDKNDHPDYLDSLTLQLPLKETYMPFVFTKATKIPAGWRCEFFDAKQKDDYGRLGRTITAVIGEEIGASGYLLKGYEQKETKQAIKGSESLKKTVDVSEATVARKNDGKMLKLVIVSSKKAKPAPVDVQATLVYARGTPRNFDVVSGSDIVLSGVKYRVLEVKAVGKGAQVTLENSLSGKKRILQAP